MSEGGLTTVVFQSSLPPVSKASVAGAAAAEAASEGRDDTADAEEAEHKNGAVTTTRVYQTELL